MALANYTDLTAAIADWGNRTDLTSQIPDFIRLTEARMVSDFVDNGLQFKLAETETITTATNPITLDSGYRGTIQAYIETDPKRVLDYMPPDDFYRRYVSSETGRPRSYTIRQQNMYIGPEADATYNIEHWFIKMPDIATDTTNEILTNYPNIYLFGALTELHAYLRDGERDYWLGRYIELIEKLADEEHNLGSLQIYVKEAGAGSSRRYYR